MTAAETLYVDPAMLRRWFARALPGQRTIYAHGPALDRHHATARLTAEWIAAREVIPYKKRDAATGLLAHGVIRRAPDPVSPSGPVAGDAPGDAIDPRSNAGRVLAHLTAVAARGDVAPTNREIALALNMRSEDVVRHALRQICAAGLVRVTMPHGQHNRRRIEIAATGAVTADVRMGVSAG